MLYRPDHFKEDRLPVLHEAIRKIGFGTLITLCSIEGEDRDRIVASHVPMLLDPSRGAFGTLRGHLAKPNGQWKWSSKTIDGLATFLGPDAYISPSMYPTKKETGRVVPTWNYIAVHAYGKPVFFDDVEWLRELVTSLTNVHESKREEPWAVTDAPESYVNDMLKGIVGFEMPIEQIDGKWKLSQNKTLEDRQGVVEAMQATLPESP
jgi:transcriptional regulator